jgi:hypothetical protein
VANAQITADPGGFGTGGVAQDRRCRRDDHILEVAKDRNERVRKPSDSALLPSTSLRKTKAGPQWT